MTGFYQDLATRFDSTLISVLLYLLVAVLVCFVSFLTARLLLKRGLKWLLDRSILTEEAVSQDRIAYMTLPWAAPLMVCFNLVEVQKWLTEHTFVARIAGLIGLVALCWVTFVLVHRLLLALLHFAGRQTRFEWDDIVLGRGAFDKLSYLAPAMVVAAFPDPIPLDNASTHRIVTAYVIVVVALALSNLLSAANDIYERYVEFAKERPIKGYIQVVKLLMIIVAVVVVLATVLDRSPVVLLSGLGAMTAVLLLIFRDTILSFVASIQIASNDMVRIGDWIEMPQYGADGDVVDIALHTIKVQNWDKTITTIPTHKLIADSFQNWRGMQDSGGRRIKRQVYIDQSSVRFCDEDMLKRFEGIQHLTEYVRTKREELERSNLDEQVQLSEPVNGRRMTNLGTFRAYVLSYLLQHPEIHQDMTLLVRQLEPTSCGIPIQIYCFTTDIRWASYERIQADIFDHLLAVVPEFGLRVFQHPTGQDISGVFQTELGPAGGNPDSVAVGGAPDT